MKLLITGASGQLGSSLLQVLKSETFKAEICALDEKQLDICDLESTERIITREKPDIIINCSAYTDVDGCESNEALAYMVNAWGVKNLTQCARLVGAKLVHISTDFVFDGNTTLPYCEDAPTAPLNVYGKTKLEGEKFALEYEKSFVLRTAWLYGRNKSNFVSTIEKLCKDRKEISVVTDQVGSPTFAEDLSRCILKLMLTENYGLYHCTNSGFCSKYELAKELVRLSGNNCLVSPCLSDKFPSPAKRPKFSALNCSKLEKTLNINLRDWKSAIKDYFKKEMP